MLSFYQLEIHRTFASKIFQEWKNETEKSTIRFGASCRATGLQKVWNL